MGESDARSKALELARQRIAAGQPLAWFEELYRSAAGDPSVIPWASLGPSGYLMDYLRRVEPKPAGKRAIVVGCGLGDDAEALQRVGYNTTAFDIAPSAIDWAQNRFPDTSVDYVTMDLFKVPGEWYRQFDFVFESLTVQAMPPELHNKALAAVSKLLDIDGTLLVVTRLAEDGEERAGPPWALTEDELHTLRTHGLQRTEFRIQLEADRDPPVRRLVAAYTRAPDRS